MIPSWCSRHPDCWEMLVDKWCHPDWEERHSACRERRLRMPGIPHHQGSLSLHEYAERWVCQNISFLQRSILHKCLILSSLFFQSSSHSGETLNTFQAFALSHKGKATSDVRYNPEDPPSAYTNPTAHSRLASYSEVAKEVHGSDYDPSAHDLDGEVVMRAGGGKRHGRYYLGDGVLDTASTPSLSQIRARTTSSGPSIRARPTVDQLETQALKVIPILFIVLSFAALRWKHLMFILSLILQTELQEARVRQEQMEARLHQYEESQRQMFAYMQSLSQQMGHPMPPMPFLPPPPPISPVSSLKPYEYIFSYLLCYLENLGKLRKTRQT